MQAIEKLNGKHDFSAFTTKQGRTEILEKQKNPIKDVQFQIYFDNKSFLSEYMHTFDEKYSIIEVEVKSTSFLYRMVRKMIGAAVDVARGRIPLERIDQMFENPAEFYNDNTSLILNPNGLFLKNVEYKDQSLN
jgi:tRNA pseudouridine(38-40) synthase